MPNSANDSFYNSEVFQNFFRGSARSLIIRADGPLFTVLAVSDKYLELTHKTRDEILNKGLFEVFPGSDADPTEKYSVFSSFERVIETRMADELPTFKYDIYVPGLGRMNTQYWSNLNEPFFDGDGNVAYIVNTTTNITGEVLGNLEVEEARQIRAAYTNEQYLNEELLASNENLALDNAQLGIEQKILQDLIAKLTESEAKVEQAELTLRLAMEAADVGTWYIHCPNRDFRPSLRLKALFGFYPEENMLLDQFISQITEEHRERIKSAVELAISAVGPYDESYPVVGFHDQRVRWVRALGNTSLQHGDFLAFTGVIMDITESKEDEQRKNDFISMVSHELKSPLTALNGYTQLLGARAKKSEDNFTAETVGKMTNQVKKMTGMINGFLNKGHLESGKIQLQLTEFNVDELVNELIEEIRSSVTTHVINIGQCDAVSVYADRDKIANVVSNLLSNAIKYSPDGRNVAVNCAVVGERVQVSVRDEGIGISPKDSQHLFERYKRIKNDQTEKIAGFGIGLYLCAEIVRRHQGDIWVESEAGSGSTFCFSLPLHP